MSCDYWFSTAIFFIFFSSVPSVCLFVRSTLSNQLVSNIKHHTNRLFLHCCCCCFLLFFHQKKCIILHFIHILAGILWIKSDIEATKLTIRFLCGICVLATHVFSSFKFYWKLSARFIVSAAAKCKIRANKQQWTKSVEQMWTMSWRTDTQTQRNRESEIYWNNGFN